MFLLRAKDTLSQRPHLFLFFFFCTEAGYGLVLGQGPEGSRAVGSFLPCGNGWDGNHSASYQPTFKTSVDLDLSQQFLLTAASLAPAQSETHHQGDQGNSWLPLYPGGSGGSGRYPGEVNGNPFQYSSLGNPMDRGAWQATIHGVANSQA